MSLVIMISCFLISQLGTELGVYSLRGAKGIPVSDTAMDNFELFVCLIPCWFLMYALRSTLFESDPGGFGQRQVGLVSAFAIVAGVLQYFGLSSNQWMISALLWVLWLCIRCTKPGWARPGSILTKVLLSPVILSPHVLYGSLMIHIPFYLLVAEPHLKNLTSTSPTAAYIYAKRKYLEIMCGMLGNAVLGYYLRFPSEDLMLALCFFSWAFLGNFGVVKPCTDFGIIQFLVTSGLQCAVNLYGLLHLYTCLVVVSGCVVMVLKWQIELCVSPAGNISWLMKGLRVKTLVPILLVSCHLIKVPAPTVSGISYPFPVMMSINSLYLLLWGWKLLSTGCIIGIGGGNRSNPISALFLYVRFREVLHVFVRHMGRLQMNKQLSPRPPGLPI